MNKWKEIKILGCKVSNKILIFSIQFLKRVHVKVIEKFGTSIIDNPNKYESLIPNENADQNNQYSKMFQVALDTPKNNNIAVTGTYGSGKSSFLRTFEKRHQEWEYLHISLATFQDINIDNMKTGEPTKGGDNEPPTNSNEVKAQPKIGYEQLNQILEKSILQQIFYKEKDKTIPFSRFKRINNIKNNSLILHCFFIGMLFLYSLSIFLPKKVEQFLMCDINQKILEYSFVSWLMFVILVFYFYKIFQYFMKLQVSKFNIKSGEIEVNNKDRTSILNEHLDELLYFFEVTSYNVVVIEDLDRFSNAEIYIKLRELNTLINNSKDIGRRVVFVYAIKDDMFKDKDRTKFFDFIVPIIPYINSSNSFNQIKKKFKNENIDEEYLRNISLRIDDMRLLINIANEYKIYKHKIGSEKLNRERLLAMIIYKNFYPSDFAKLHINEGNVYDIFNQRAKFIKEELEKNKQLQIDKNKEISELENKISLEKQKYIQELRMVYILKIFEKVNAASIYFGQGQYSINNVKAIISNEVFNALINSASASQARGYSEISISGIEKEIHELKYKEREELIVKHPNKQLEQLKKELELLEMKESEIKKYNISQIAQIEDSKIFEKIEKENLLKFLIRDGFIREDYYDYISYFFPGSLTLKDRDFVLSVKDNKPLEFEYQLSNIKEVIINLTSNEFESKAILNYSLLDYILEHNIKDEKFEHFMINLMDENDKSKEFILSFILITQNQKTFIEVIIKKWIRIWFYIYSKSNLTEEKKDEYFKIFLELLNIDDLVKLNIENSIKYFIESKHSLTLNYIDSKFQELIQRIRIKYKYLENPVEENPTLFEFIYKNNLYQINEKMINKIVFIKGEPKETSEEKLKVAHYSTIQESEAQELKEYIEENINEYVENIFLKIETNKKENERYIKELLNHENIDDKYKERVIEKVETKTSDISEIKNQELWKILFAQNKITAVWSNILHYYQYVEKSFDNIIIDFIAIEENYKNLSNHKIYNEKQFEEETIKSLSLKLITLDEFENDCYSYIVRSLFSYTNISKVSNEKIDILLKNNKLVLTQENIDYLKGYSSNKQIVLIENLEEEFLGNYDKFNLDENDYIGIFESSKFTMDDKLTIIDKLNLTIFDNEKLAKIVTDFYLNNKIEISNEIFFKLFEKGNFEDSLKLLTNQIPKLEDERITDLLNQFENIYNELTEKSAKSLKFDKTKINEDLLMALNKKGFIEKVDKEKKEIIVHRKRV